MTKLSCPFCNAVFDVPAPVPDRIPCPRCDENVPATAIAPPDAHAISVVEPRPREKPSRFWMIGIAIVLCSAIAFIAYSFQNKLPITAPTGPAEPQAVTRPPAMLSSLRYLPANTQLAFTIQPAALAEYAKRKEQPVDLLMKDAGLPPKLFDEFRRLGLTPERIEQLAVAIPEGDVRPVAVLVLRPPLPDDADFRKKLNARPVTDRPGHFEVELFNLRLEMKKDGDATYHFAADGKQLDTPPAPGADHLPQGLRDSLSKLSPASFAWLASDTVRPNWGANPTLIAAALLLKQPELPKRFEGVQAFALGLAPEPELKLILSVRTPDAKGLTERFRERLNAAKADVAADGDWATAAMPFDPPQDALATLRKALGQ